MSKDKKSSKNLIPQAHKLTVEEQSTGGKKSAENKKEQKTVRKLVDDILQKSVTEYPQIEKLAQKLGVNSGKSIKEIFVIIATLNTLKKANFDDLEKLANLLGENDYKDEKISKVEMLLAGLFPNEKNTMD